ncbi:MAG: Asp-tRNA(Asn)/Glu-tRNA(Gln) amidotransferase subunit GatC [bacterium]
MGVTSGYVRHIADLGRLDLSDEERETFASQLNDILEYAAMLNELDTEGVEPASHVVPLKNVFREDVVRESFPVEEVLSNAPDARGNFFCVPKIIEE